MSGTTIIHCGNPTCTKTISTADYGAAQVVDGDLRPLIESAGWRLIVGQPFMGVDEHGNDVMFDNHSVAMCPRCAP